MIQRIILSARSGVSIIEVLIALIIFSVAVVGLFTVMNGINAGIATSMRRDIETTYANMLLAQINPYDQLVETAYDKSSTACSGSRCSIVVPSTNETGAASNEKFFYTILVDSDSNVSSDPATADVKRINMYLYRDATTTTPYRQFRREIAPDIMGWKLGGAKTYYRDATGVAWTRIGVATNYNTTAGSVTGGIDVAATPSGLSFVGGSNPTNLSIDQYLWSSSAEPGASGTQFGFAFPATKGRTYYIEIGVNESDNTVVAGSRVFDVYVNDQKVDTIDTFNLSGGLYKALTRSYSAQPTVISNTPMIKIRFQQNGGTKKPRVSWIRIRRS